MRLGAPADKKAAMVGLSELAPDWCLKLILRPSWQPTKTQARPKVAALNTRQKLPPPTLPISSEFFNNECGDQSFLNFGQRRFPRLILTLARHPLSKTS
jgi:hypothetical protein